jgi:hypothetical protein
MRDYAIPSVVFAGMAGCAAWGMSRLATAIAASIWMARRALPDMRWIERVAGYETSFVWMYCLFNATAFTLIATGFSFVKPYLTRPVLWGIPLVPLIFLAGNVLITVLWQWRYARVLAAIRFNNH